MKSFKNIKKKEREKMKSLKLLLIIIVLLIVGCENNNNPVEFGTNKAMVGDSTMLYSSTDTFTVNRIEGISDGYKDFGLSNMQLNAGDIVKLSFRYDVTVDSNSYLYGDNLMLIHYPYNLWLTGNLRTDTVTYYKKFTVDYPCNETIIARLVWQYGCSRLQIYNLNLYKQLE
jgi:hypothetical protein